MPTQPSFDPAALERLDRVREVRIQTTSIDGARTHRTIIWIVTAAEQVFIRSVRGTAGRWYREALRRPDVLVHAEGVELPVTAVPANDQGTIQLVSDAFKAKYGKRAPGSTASMLQPHTLETTIRLDPRGESRGP
jgi:hypothetical protein